MYVMQYCAYTETNTDTHVSPNRNLFLHAIKLFDLFQFDINKMMERTLQDEIVMCHTYVSFKHDILISWIVLKRAD